RAVYALTRVFNIKKASDNKTKQTLEDTGYELGLTRERVRQMKNNLIKDVRTRFKEKFPNIDPATIFAIFDDTSGVMLPQGSKSRHLQE
ncbi:MAG: hypothetical protein WCT36_04280, partial [Candidatus Gracilibacteria bacterium]